MGFIVTRFLGKTFDVIVCEESADIGEKSADHQSVERIKLEKLSEVKEESREAVDCYRGCRLL